MAVQVDSDKCEGTGECVKVCPTDALTVVDGQVKVDEPNCAECGVCTTVCPVNALSL